MLRCMEQKKVNVPVGVYGVVPEYAGQPFLLSPPPLRPRVIQLEDPLL